MISIREEIAISMPPDVLWPILSDSSMVASCIPGAALTKSGEGGTYQGTMRVKFGPTVALFRGEANSFMTILTDAARSRGAGSTGGVPRGQMPPGQSRRPAATRLC
jgi:carbon monoxide dehydrogenase subunit G